MKLSKKQSITSLEVIFKDSNKVSTTVSITLRNIAQVNIMLQQYWGENDDSTIIKKLEKAASQALTHGQLLDITNYELLEANKRKQRKAARTNEHWSEDQIITLEIVQEWKQQYAAKQTLKKNCQRDWEWAHEVKEINRLESDLFVDKKIRGKGSRKKLLPILKKIHWDHEEFQDIDDFLNLKEFLNLGEPPNQAPQIQKPSSQKSRNKKPSSQKPRSQTPSNQNSQSHEAQHPSPSSAELVKKTATRSGRLVRLPRR